MPRGFSEGFLKPKKDGKKGEPFLPSRLRFESGMLQAYATDDTGAGTVNLTIPQGSKVFGLIVDMRLSSNNPSCTTSIQIFMDGVQVISQNLFSGGNFTIPQTLRDLFEIESLNGQTTPTCTFAGVASKIQTISNLTRVQFSISGMTQSFATYRGISVTIAYEPPLT